MIALAVHPGYVLVDEHEYVQVWCRRADRDDRWTRRRCTRRRRYANCWEKGGWAGAAPCWPATTVETSRPAPSWCPPGPAAKPTAGPPPVRRRGDERGVDLHHHGPAAPWPVADGPAGQYLSWRVGDPYVVELQVCSGRAEVSDVVWLLSRELLAEGLTCEAGWGDVRILPDPV